MPDINIHSIAYYMLIDMQLRTQPPRLNLSVYIVTVDGCNAQFRQSRVRV